jgi:predicted TIM-barrel fold metal-dependent hydrolase
MQARPHPRIDAHAHLGRWLQPGVDWMASDVAGSCEGPWLVSDPDALVASMDEQGVAATVNLDGRWGPELEANLERYDCRHPGRFLTFCHVDWRRAGQGDGFGDELAGELERSAAAGARGLKVWKTLGLGFRDRRGELLLPSDERAGPVFETAGDLGLPVLIHTADPAAFFHPLDDDNERAAELRRHPEWSFAGPGFPTHEELIDSFEALVAAHPGTIFIGAHLAGCAEDPGRVAAMLAGHANLYVDIAARLSDLARRPAEARRLLRDHAGRILFGSDSLGPSAHDYEAHFRFLEGGGPVPDPFGENGESITGLALAHEELAALYGGAARAALTLEEGGGHGPAA